MCKSEMRKCQIRKRPMIFASSRTRQQQLDALSFYCIWRRFLVCLFVCICDDFFLSIWAACVFTLCFFSRHFKSASTNTQSETMSSLFLLMLAFVWRWRFGRASNHAAAEAADAMQTDENNGGLNHPFHHISSICVIPSWLILSDWTCKKCMQTNAHYIVCLPSRKIFINVQWVFFVFYSLADLR